MEVSLIVCINKVNALGKDNKLLYHIKEDLANFKRLTLGNILIMGKNTYESLPKKPLSKRTTIIIADDKEYKPEVSEGEEVFVCDSIESALSTAEVISEEKEVFVVGGASIYRQFIEQDLVDTMFITLVDDDMKGDVVFPNINESEWQTIFKVEAHHEENQPRYGYIILKKKKNA